MCTCVTPHWHVLRLYASRLPHLSSLAAVCDRDVKVRLRHSVQAELASLNLYRFPFPRPICCSISGAAPCKHANPSISPFLPLTVPGFSRRGALDKRAQPERGRSLRQCGGGGSAWRLIPETCLRLTRLIRIRRVHTNTRARGCNRLFLLFKITKMQ